VLSMQSEYQCECKMPKDDSRPNYLGFQVKCARHSSMINFYSSIIKSNEHVLECPTL